MKKINIPEELNLLKANDLFFFNGIYLKMPSNSEDAVFINLMINYVNSENKNTTVSLCETEEEKTIATLSGIMDEVMFATERIK